MKSVPIKVKKLSSRVILLVLTLELISITIWGLATYTNSRNELLKSISSQLHQVALRMDTELTGFIEPATTHVFALRDSVQGLNLSIQDMIPIINEIFNSRPEINELSLVDENGKEVYRHGRLFSFSGSEKRDFSADPLFKSAKLHDRSIDEVQFTQYYEPSMRMFFKIGNERGNDIYVELVLNLKFIWALAQKQVMGSSGYVYIVASNGKLISFPDHSKVLTGKNIREQLPESLFTTHRSKKMEFYTSLSGGKVVGMSHYDKKMNWWIIVELPTKEGLLPLSRMLRSFVFIFVCAALFTVAIVVIFSRITMKPLDSIMLAINRITAGERGVQVKVRTHSELSTLADGINNMAKRLDERILQLLDSQTELLESKARYQKLNKELEQKIDLATQDLQDTNKKLTESVKLAKEASQSKSMFLANTSHELRTPLNAILGYSELICEIAEEKEDTELVEDTNKIIYSAKYLLDLINNLLDLAKIEKGKLQILPESINLPDFIDSLDSIVTPLAAANNNKFIINCAPEISTITTDITRLRQILINLVGNACKFTNNGEIDLDVYLLKIKNVDYIHFCVSDTGIGMTPDQISRLFEVFQQADARTTRRYGGSGLGLALSKQLAKMMKGDIIASSVYEQGSDFTLVIPLNYHDVSVPPNADTMQKSA